MSGRGVLKGLARGLTADALGGPVDLATAVVNLGLAGAGYAGNKLGLLKPDQMPSLIQNAVGGSDWFAKNTFLEDKKEPGYDAGRFTAAISPMAISAGMAAARPIRGQVNAITWHGSPHRFEKFDSSKIGTGEGAQAYGHGLYLAESPKVAQSYKKSTSYQDAVRQFRRELPDDAGFDDLLELADSGQLSPQSVRIVKELQNNDWLGFDYPSQAITAAFRNAKDYDVTPELQAAINDYGNLYKVDLPDAQIAKMLDWDKPLMQQSPEILARLNRSKQTPVLRALDTMDRPGVYSEALPDGSDIMRGLSLSLDGRPMGKSASRELGRLGIPGLRYLDGSSRNLGDGTSNFVVFPGNEDMLTILERNGQPLLRGLANGR